MRILPVLDLMAGRVVRGVAGNRQLYRELQTPWSKSAAPGEIAAALARHFGFQEAYIADLDAIGGADPNINAWKEIAAAGLEKLWVDAGIGDMHRVQQLLGGSAAPMIQTVIIGLETISSPAALPRLVQEIGAGRACFSLDLKGGKLLSRCPELAQTSPRRVTELALQAGFRRIIVLDLSRVGCRQGPPLPWLKDLIPLDPTAQWIAGGGVRNLEDLKQLAEIGCEAALVATALYEGSLTKQQLAGL